MEREADRIGFQVMVAAGLRAGGMASMFEKMDTPTRSTTTAASPTCARHPLTVERIGEARSRASMSPRSARQRPRDTSSRRRAARVLMDKRVDALRRWQRRDADGDNGGAAERLLNLYESAFASSLLRDWRAADARVRQGARRSRGRARTAGAAPSARSR
jgi:predicted Zn-dependent protease